MNNIELKENRVHGSFILPFTTYFVELTDSTSSNVVTHWHEEIEILFIEKGSAEFKVDLDSHILKEGDILIINPYSLHSMHPINDIYCCWNVMLFNLGMLNSATIDGCLIKYFAPILNNEHQLPLIIDNSSNGYSEIAVCIKEIFKNFNSKNIAFELKLKSLLFCMFSLLYENNLVIKKKAALFSNKATEKIRIILNYIHLNYMNQLAISDIAHTCSLSEYYFMKFFKKNLGITCTEYINLYRLHIAAELLNTTDKSITEISFETGFNNVSYFNKLFKEKFKVTPKAFRGGSKK